MEFCTGGSLQTAFEEGPMSLKKVMKVIRQTASGLHILHTRGMLHRDIKPGNLLQDRHGVTKLADFGLVTDKLLKGYASSAGYLDHLAYEVWHTGRTSVQSDIWALGMTMYRLLHGALWYSRAPDPKDVIINGGFADTLNWLPHIPKAWRTLVKKMMSDDLDLRPKNAMQVLAALAKLSCEPNWKCTVRPTGVSWRRKTNDRLIRVRWTTHSPRKHEWRAWSEPLSTGRSRTLEESGGIITRTAAEKELRAFFAK
jgi:serine/threonine-protein kinase